MEYNTKRESLTIPEYGRHVQKMISHALTLKDKDKQQKCVDAIIKFMGQMNPHLRDIKEFTHKLWDHLHIMSNFKLDLDSPYPKPEVEKLKESQGGVIYHDQDEKLREEILYKSRGENSDFVQRVAQNNDMDSKEVSQIITSTEREDQDAKQELLYNIGNDVQENVDYDLDTDFQITPKYLSDGVSINPKWTEERIKDKESFTLY